MFVNHAEMIITNLLVVKQHVNVALVTKLPVKITGHNVLYVSNIRWLRFR
jgi:hypothetical protein